jgi:hypothetical protein
MRGGREKDGMRAKVSSVQRSGGLLGRDLLCHKEEGRGFEGEMSRRANIDRGERAFENLTGLNGDDKDEREGSRARR